MDKIFKLKRTDFTGHSTIGELYDPEGNFICFSLEDQIRRYKIYGKTAIPCGTYEMIIAWSSRNQRLMPRLLSVPFFSGILVHPGNTASDSAGCILVGKKKGVDVIYDSVLAFESLFPMLKKSSEKGKLFLEIHGGFSPAEWIKEDTGVVTPGI